MKDIEHDLAEERIKHLDDLLQKYKTFLLAKERQNLLTSWVTNIKQSIEASQTTIVSLTKEVSNKFDNILKKSDEIRILLGELKYILRNLDEGSPNNMKKAEEIVGKIKKKIDEADTKMDVSKWWDNEKPTMQIVLLSLRRIYERQMNLPMRLDEYITKLLEQEAKVEKKSHSPRDSVIDGISMQQL